MLGVYAVATSKLRIRLTSCTSMKSRRDHLPPHPPRHVRPGTACCRADRIRRLGHHDRCWHASQADSAPPQVGVASSGHAPRRRVAQGAHRAWYTGAPDGAEEDHNQLATSGAGHGADPPGRRQTPTAGLWAGLNVACRPCAGRSASTRRSAVPEPFRSPATGRAFCRRGHGRSNVHLPAHGQTRGTSLSDGLSGVLGSPSTTQGHVGQSLCSRIRGIGHTILRLRSLPGGALLGSASPILGPIRIPRRTSSRAR